MIKEKTKKQLEKELLEKDKILWSIMLIGIILIITKFITSSI